MTIDWTTEAIALMDEFMAVRLVADAPCIDDLHEDVVSLAICDLDEIVEHADIDDRTRKQLTELLDRVTS